MLNGCSHLQPFTSLPCLAQLGLSVCESRLQACHSVLRRRRVPAGQKEHVCFSFHGVRFTFLMINKVLKVFVLQRASMQIDCIATILDTPISAQQLTKCSGCTATPLQHCSGIFIRAPSSPFVSVDVASAPLAAVEVLLQAQQVLVQRCRLRRGGRQLPLPLVALGGRLRHRLSIQVSVQEEVAGSGLLLISATGFMQALR